MKCELYRKSRNESRLTVESTSTVIVAVKVALQKFSEATAFVWINIIENAIAVKVFIPFLIQLIND
jgi:hypothetical protein